MEFGETPPSRKVHLGWRNSSWDSYLLNEKKRNTSSQIITTISQVTVFLFENNQAIPFSYKISVT